MKVSSAKADSSAISNTIDTKIGYSTCPRTEPCTVPRCRSRQIEFSSQCSHRMIFSVTTQISTQSDH
jgi:hypothetical protein